MLALLLILLRMDLLRRIHKKVIGKEIVRRHIVIVYAADDVPIYECQGLCLLSRVMRGMSMMTPVAHADIGNHDRIGWTVLRLQIGVVPWMHFRELIEYSGRIFHRVEHQCRDLHHIMNVARGVVVE